MVHTHITPPGPDLGQGVPLERVPDAGVLAGHVDGVPVLLTRLDDGLHAVGGACTHYGAPLAEGLVAGNQIRCPWHHACFSLRTGAALQAPAFMPLSRWHTEIVGDRVFVRAQAPAIPPAPPRRQSEPERIVIVGGGAAGFAAAQRLRELGFDGALTMLSADSSPPCDRPNLSKDYLAGTAPEDWIPLQEPEFYAEQRIDLRLQSAVTAIDARARRVTAAAGETFAYAALLLATGAEPRRLSTPGLDRPNVLTLRSLADARAIIAACANARSVAFVGAGFIGMEAAGALRARGLQVHVVTPEAVPLERALGPEIGRFIARLHEEQGVVFHLSSQLRAYDGRRLMLENGDPVPADFVVVGVGVIPRTQLAKDAGIAVQDGILVDAQLRTSMPGIHAAGDVARYPHGAERVRVEHWVHAQRQGQVAAANMLGAAHAYTDVPFFWTHHHGLDLRCAGIAHGWDEIRIDGDLDARDFSARYFRDGRMIAAATAGRDQENLRIEAELLAAAAAASA